MTLNDIEDLGDTVERLTQDTYGTNASIEIRSFHCSGCTDDYEGGVYSVTAMFSRALEELGYEVVRR